MRLLALATISVFASVAVGQTTVREGETVPLVGHIDIHFAISLTISWTVEPGTADSSDYSPRSGQATIPPQADVNVPLQPFTVGHIQILDDDVAEGSETFQVRYTVVDFDPERLTLANNPQTFLIEASDQAADRPVDDPEPPPVDDDPEPLVLTGPAFKQAALTREIPETARPDDEVGDPIVVDDPGKGDVTYTLAGPDEHLFDIDQNGQITVADGATFDYEAEGRLVVRVTAEDRGGDTATVLVVILVLDVNEAPALGEFDRLAVPEDARAGRTVGDPVSATDPDGDALTCSLLGDDASAFVIDPDSGQISVAENAGLDFETQDRHMFTVVVTDPDGASASRQVTVLVTDVAPATRRPSGRSLGCSGVEWAGTRRTARRV